MAKLDSKQLLPLLTGSFELSGSLQLSSDSSITGSISGSFKGEGANLTFGPAKQPFSDISESLGDRLDTIEGDSPQQLGETNTPTFAGLSITNGLTVGGDITAESFIVSSSVTHMTQSFSSGSTVFGDTLDDTHEFTGSLLITGSLSMNNYSVTEISNDTTLADSNAEALVTENAAKTYIDNQTDDQQAYLRKQFVKLSSSITIPGTASFSATSASAPTGMTSTSENDFIFFINGQYMEHDAIQIQQESSTFRLIVDNDSIGYDLESDDEILAIGKFNS